MPRGWPLVVIIVLVLLLFAAPKLPQLARNLGQSMRIFRSEVKTMKDEDEQDGKTNEPAKPVEGTVLSEDDTTGSHAAGKKTTGDTR